MNLARQSSGPADQPAAGVAPPTWLLAIVLAAACYQGRWPGHASATGEELGYGIPVATMVLAIACLLQWCGRSRRPAWPRRHSLLLVVASIGLLGLSRAELAGGIKELVQLGEVFIASWWLFAGVRREQALALGGCIAALGLALISLQPAWLGLSANKLAVIVIAATPFVVGRMWWLHRGAAQAVVCLMAWLVGSAFVDGGLILCWLLVLGLAVIWQTGARAWRWLIVPTLLLSVAAGRSMTAPDRGLYTLLPKHDAGHVKRLFLEYRAALTAPATYPLGGGLGAYKSRINHLRLSLPQPDAADMKIRRDSNNQYLLSLVEAGPLLPIVLLFLLLAAAVGARRRAAGCQGEQRWLLIAAGLACLGLLLAGNFAVILARGSGIWVGAMLGLVSAGRLDRSTRWRWYLPLLATAAALLAAWRYNTNAPGQTISALNARLAGCLAKKSAYAPEVMARVIRYSKHGVPVVEPLTGAQAESLTLQIEGESFVSSDGDFLVVPANDASGDRTLEIPAGSGKALGEVRYQVTIEQPGSYRLTARVHWQDGCSNSLGFNAVDQELVIASELFTQWHELSAVRLLQLPAGVITVTVQNLEDGSQTGLVPSEPGWRHAIGRVA